MAFALCGTSLSCHALGSPPHVFATNRPGSFPLVTPGHAASLYVDLLDWPGVQRATTSFAADVTAVSGLQPTFTHQISRGAGDVVIIGTLGHSALIDRLVRTHKLDVSSIRGLWETSITQVIVNPIPGVSRALVIAGADKRGTIFAIYDLSEQIGVSPWVWWADVPVRHRDSLFVGPGPHLQTVPAVKYRGIFLNDEAPSLTGWVQEKFGGFNHFFYEHVFELLLRLKANLLWPAMWNSAFNEDDPLNPKLADEYGIVMGTSHHEPMMRAQQEWKRHGKGPWNYATNAAELDDFWHYGVHRNKNYESLTTIGMRGDGDMAMSPGTNTALLEQIVAAQRRIIATQVNPKVTAVPQVWALYKEVQDYYEAGMRVPGDVTLLWSDDNWGNIRRLPTAAERRRPGGAGIYYHFDYVGGPRSYKWINTYSIAKVQEQMNLAWRYDATREWIVNVGDLKPMEFPLEFFLSMAREPGRWTANNLHEYVVEWATREFGPEDAEEIASCMEDYERYISRRKPEMLAPGTFSFENFNEATRVEEEWKRLIARSDALMQKLPENEQAAYFELLGYEIDAAGNDVQLYLDAGRNAYYAQQGWADANLFNAQSRLQKDAELSSRYNHLLNSKWDHMMDQTHIGYTFWNEPLNNLAPPPIHLDVPEHGGISVSTQVSSPLQPTLGTFIDPSDRSNSPHPLILFNKGRTPISYTTSTSAPWIKVVRPSSDNPFYEPVSSGLLNLDDTLGVSIDWQSAPANNTDGSVTISAPSLPDIVVPLHLVRFHWGKHTGPESLESNGYVAIDAARTSSRTVDQRLHWQQLPGYGEAQAAMTPFPVLASSELHSTASLNYQVALYDSGGFTLQFTLAPTLNFVPGRGLRFAVSLDNGPRTIVDELSHNSDADWANAVADGVRKVELPLTVPTSGLHTIHIWAVDPGVILERLVLTHEPLPYSYLGPPASEVVVPTWTRSQP